MPGGSPLGDRGDRVAVAGRQCPERRLHRIIMMLVFRVEFRYEPPCSTALDE